MANIDRILRIHQSFTQEKISRLNKKMLAMQYAQCEQIVLLKKQIEKGNDISNRILQNQLNELQHREEQKHYKSLVFNLGGIIDYIKGVESPFLQIFLGELYFLAIVNNLNIARDALDEIGDKTYCGGLLEKLHSIQVSYKDFLPEYRKSDFAYLLENEKDYNEKKKQLHRSLFLTRMQERNNESTKPKRKTPKPLINITRRFFIILFGIFTFFVFLLMILAAITDPGVLFGLVIFSFPVSVLPLYLLFKKDRKWRKNYLKYINDFNEKVLQEDNIAIQKKEECRDIIIGLEQEQKVIEKTHPYVVAKNNLAILCPQWEEVVYNVGSLLKKYFNVSEEDDELDLDPLFHKAARIVVKYHKGSAAILQRELGIGFNRAGRLIDQLERMKIIGSFEGNKNRKVLVQDENELLYVFSSAREK